MNHATFTTVTVVDLDQFPVYRLDGKCIILL